MRGLSETQAPYVFQYQSSCEAQTKIIGVNPADSRPFEISLNAVQFYSNSAGEIEHRLRTICEDDFRSMASKFPGCTEVRVECRFARPILGHNSPDIIGSTLIAVSAFVGK